MRTLAAARAIAATLVLVSTTACQLGMGNATTAPTTCDGIPAEMGGCDLERPTFTGETCEVVAEELGQQYGSRAIAIMDGPASVDEESRSVRLAQLLVTTIQLANKHLRDLGIVDECEADPVMAIVEDELPPSFRDRIGDHLYDTAPATYDDWRAEFLNILAAIDEDEDAPYSSVP